MNTILAVAEAATTSVGLNPFEVGLIGFGIGLVAGIFLEARYGAKVSNIVKAVEAPVTAPVVAATTAK